eukprot:666593-Pelagomonas_calceolata.AAC.1
MDALQYCKVSTNKSLPYKLPLSLFRYEAILCAIQAHHAPGGYNPTYRSMGAGHTSCCISEFLWFAFQSLVCSTNSDAMQCGNPWTQRQGFQNLECARKSGSEVACSVAATCAGGAIYCHRLHCLRASQALLRRRGQLMKSSSF